MAQLDRAYLKFYSKDIKYLLSPSQNKVPYLLSGVLFFNDYNSKMYAFNYNKEFLT